MNLLKVIDGEGNDTLLELKEKNRLRIIQRLTGISTTGITEKLLNLFKKEKPSEKKFVEPPK